jgi:phosphoribosylformylglycinamidine synthase
MASSVRVLVLTGFGLNCDLETAHAFELAGARADRRHINSLIDGQVELRDYQIMVFGGGFSWGDDHGAGVIQALRMKTRLGDHLLDFIAQGNLVIGICNGFQTLVNLGLLPGLDGDYQRRSVALTYNDCGNFRDQWVHLQVNTRSACVFTRGMTHLELPVRHGEGKFFAEAAMINRLFNANQIVLHYATPQLEAAQGVFPWNPNGSIADVAGICDPSGRVFGLMPHPEAYHHPTNHPDWTRHRRSAGLPKPHATGGLIVPGVQMFHNAVSYFSAS